MKEFLKKRWFLTALVTLITLGITLGYYVDPGKIGLLRTYVPSRWVTALVLALMAFSLDSRKLKESFRSPGPVVWACSTNYLLIPILGLMLMGFQRTPDFRIGLMIACTTPCTLAACSVWTRKAGGNDAVSLLTTLTTNTACFAMIPLWLAAATSSTGAESEALDYYKLSTRLIFVVLIPTILGQLVRQPVASEQFATKHKTPIGVVAQSLILLLVFLGASSGGVKLQEQGNMSGQLTGLMVVWLSCVAIHLTALAVAWYGSGLFGFRREDRIATAFAGSQKTLPIGVYLATSTFGGASAFENQAVPFAVFPMLMFHASQLFLDTIVADRLHRKSDATLTEPAVSSAESTVDE